MPDLEAIAAKAKAQLPSKAESKGAASAPSAEIKKTEDEVKKAAQEAEAKKSADEKATKAKDLEAKAKQDEEILSRGEEELNDDQKKRKTELVKIKQDAEDKEKKSNVQKRFDELTSKIKILEADKDSTKAERDSLKAELDGIKKQLAMTPQDKSKERIKGELMERRKKALEEDKKLPREERREMAKEELDEWAMEDYEGAQEWISKRTIRRYSEENNLHQEEDLKAKAEVILDKQQKSAERTFDKHPELKDLPAKRAALIKAGKSKEEVIKILGEENPKYKLVMEIYSEDPDKFVLSENAPELIVTEMEKRLGKAAPLKDDEKETLKQKLIELEAENAKLKGLDSSISSNRQAEPEHAPTDLEKERTKIGAKVGLTQDRLDAAVKRRADLGYDS